MNYFLSAFSGGCVSLLILINGWLASAIGVYQSIIIFNIVAGIISFIACVLLKSHWKRSKVRWYLYLGGLINVFVVLFNNLAFGKISVSSILAISLFGQALVSTLIDHLGLFNNRKIPFSPTKILAYVVILIGIFVLLLPLQDNAYFAIFISLLTGFLVILARIINAEYARHESSAISTLLNYIIGSAGIIIISNLFYNISTINTIKMLSTVNPLLLIGGIFGVGSVIINNYVTPKISSFYLTLFLFIGQVFTGIICDIIIDGTFSSKNLFGGIFVLVGLIINMYADKTIKS